MAAEHGTTATGSPAGSRSATPTRPPSPELRAPPEHPIPKRPQARVAAPGIVTRVMTQEQVVAGLIEVHGLVTRDENFTMGIHEAVDDNAVILEHVISKLADLEMQMNSMTAASDVNTGDIGKVKAYAEQEMRGWTNSFACSLTP